MALFYFDLLRFSSELGGEQSGPGPGGDGFVPPSGWTDPAKRDKLCQRARQRSADRRGRPDANRPTVINTL
jgi:hypothetical protein